ncbi:MAG TPA: ATP-binding protein, partial [Candidatus Binataceae bacterium]|nr:ATP-binding protein [Candidatus Binataceae bacterium]
TTWFSRPDWLAVEIQAIWFALTLGLWAATWHSRFPRIWKPVVLIFSGGLILSAGVLSLNGASLAPFMFLLVLLPVGGAILPWEPKWQAAMSSLCLLLGLFFAVQFNWHNHLVISGLSAMVASIVGSHLVTAAQTRQREKINDYLYALAGSEEKFRKIFETSGSLIAIHEIPDGRTMDVNPAWERTFGCSRQDAVGSLPEDLGFTPDPGSFIQWLSRLKVGDTGSERMPVALRGRKGNLVHCVYSWTTLELNGRDCVVIVGQDVTARVEAEEALRLNREVLLNQERLKAVGELASGIAHDLNNSLNALRLRVELLCNDPALIGRHNDALQLIVRIVRDAASTIARLQDFARRGDERPIESVDLNAIIEQSVEIAKSTLEERNSLLGRSIQIESNVPVLPPIVGDAAELRQTFLNLLLNAQDAMPAGGTIRILASAQTDQIVVKVEDEGLGIPEENLTRIFVPFFSTKGEHGTGLGLSIAAASMARLGGTISAANRPSRGAVFILTFPLGTAKAARQPVNYAPPMTPRRILLIDDDVDNLQALSALLQWKGHSVISTRSSFDALNLLNHSQVDVVCCDLGMPELNGWELASRIKALNDAPAFYLLTGWVAEIRPDDPRRALVDAVLPKPVDPGILDELLADGKSKPPRPDKSFEASTPMNGNARQSDM